MKTPANPDSKILANNNASAASVRKSAFAADNRLSVEHRSTFLRMLASDAGIRTEERRSVRHEVLTILREAGVAEEMGLPGWMDREGAREVLEAPAKWKKAA